MLLTPPSPLVAACNNVCRHDPKFKSPPSHPLNDYASDVIDVLTADWLPELHQSTEFRIVKTLFIMLIRAKLFQASVFNNVK